MIHCEEKLLRSVNESIKKYALSRPDNRSFYEDIALLEALSLQSVSLNKDLIYFDEINKLFGAIITVIRRPFIVNESETVILRAEQSYGLTPEMFRETVKDTKLWKDKRGVITPKEVFYFQNIDELVNYENRFIVYLIDIVSSQLVGYVKFYDFLIGTIGSGGLVQDQSELEVAYIKLNALYKKIRRIKETDFYKIVNKANTSFTHVEPTNVFKHNRAYGECYRFFVNNVTYSDDEARNKDLSAYFFTRLLCALRSGGYEFVDGEKAGGKVVRKMNFESDEFRITVDEAKDYGGLAIEVTHKGEAITAFNLLVFDGSPEFEEVEKRLDDYKTSGFTSVDAVTAWDAAYVDESVVSSASGGVSENELLIRYLSDKTKTVKASRRIYEEHCPVCGSKDIAIGETYRCGNCGSEYTFAGEKIWLTKLRKK